MLFKYMGPPKKIKFNINNHWRGPVLGPFGGRTGTCMVKLYFVSLGKSCRTLFFVVECGRDTTLIQFNWFFNIQVHVHNIAHGPRVLS